MVVCEAVRIRVFFPSWLVLWPPRRTDASYLSSSAACAGGPGLRVIPRGIVADGVVRDGDVIAFTEWHCYSAAGAPADAKAITRPVTACGSRLKDSRRRRCSY